MADIKNSRGTFIGERFRNMKLQPKLILGFVCLSALIGVAGGSGLLFVNRIADTVGVYADVSSPLVEETTALVGGMQSMHVALLDALGRQDLDRIQATEAEITEHEGTDRKRFERLRRLSAWGIPRHLTKFRRLARKLLRISGVRGLYW